MSIRAGTDLWAILFALAASAIASFASPAAALNSPAPNEMRKTLTGISAPFVENTGQFDTGVRFFARTFAGALRVTDSGKLEYVLPRATFTETFVGGRALPTAGVPHVTRINRFVGDDASRHRDGLRTYEHVMLGEVFPGIDVRLRATGGNVEKIFTVAARQDSRRIRVAIDGALALSVADDGRLIVRLRDGDVAFTAPVAYQTTDGRQTPVQVAYALTGDAHQYGFAVGAYDRSRPLVIDPLLQATYLGGSGEDGITAMAVHPVTGDVLVAGSTLSADLPCPVGGCGAGAQAHIATGLDGFVARFDADLTTLLQLTYLGGSGNDQINALAIHPASGEVLVAGSTNSSDLPCTTVAHGCADAAQETKAAGGGDGFVARLNASLTSLLQVTYFGGTGNDEITALAVHPMTGEVLVAGNTDSSDLPCTTFANGCGLGAQPEKSGGEDGFVARLNANLTGVSRTTYFGGTSTDRIFALAVHPHTGDILAGGQTQSNDLPCTTVSINCAEGAQPKIGGGVDGFVVRFSPNLTRMLQATYIGSPAAENIFALTVHPITGEVLVAGATAGSVLPCTTIGGGCSNGAQSTSTGGETGFVARLNADLTKRLQATYFGGTAFDNIYAIVVHPRTGEVLIAGQTASTNLPCTTSGGGCGIGAQSNNGGGFDGFVARIDSNLTRILQSTYLGGSGTDLVSALAVHPVTGDVLVAGQTASTDLHCTSAADGCANGPQSMLSGQGNDGFIARLSPDLTLADAMPDPIVFPLRSGVPVSSLVTSSPAQIAGLAGPALVYVEGQMGSAYCISSADNCSCNLNGGFVASPGSVDNGQFVCVRHVSAPIADELVRTVLHVGGGAGVLRSVTGAFSAPAAGPGCSLDIDGNNVIDALTDGMLLLRAMMGFTGTAVTVGAVGQGATRKDWTAIRAFLNGNCGTAVQP